MATIKTNRTCTKLRLLFTGSRKVGIKFDVSNNIGERDERTAHFRYRVTEMKDNGPIDEYGYREPWVKGNKVQAQATLSDKNDPSKWYLAEVQLTHIYCQNSVGQIFSRFDESTNTQGAFVVFEGWVLNHGFEVSPITYSQTVLRGLHLGDSIHDFSVAADTVQYVQYNGPTGLGANDSFHYSLDGGASSFMPILFEKVARALGKRLNFINSSFAADWLTDLNATLRGLYTAGYVPLNVPASPGIAGDEVTDNRWRSYSNETAMPASVYQNFDYVAIYKGINDLNLYAPTVVLAGASGDGSNLHNGAAFIADLKSLIGNIKAANAATKIFIFGPHKDDVVPYTTGADIATALTDATPYNHATDNNLFYASLASRIGASSWDVHLTESQHDNMAQDLYESVLAEMQL